MILQLLIIFLRKMVYDYNFNEEFDSIDIQKEYEKDKKVSIGLKKFRKGI